MESRKSVILMGAGFAGTTHWIPGISRSAPFRLIGVIDPDEHARNRAVESAPGIWAVAMVADAVPLIDHPQETIVFVATPDHLPAIHELGNHGFRKLIVEKPLVREGEVVEFEQYVRLKGISIYSVDHYYQKFLPLEFVLGRLVPNDPRVASLKLHGDHSHKEIPGCLGKIEGVTYTNIEAGDLGIPYLDTHPYLEYDAEIGGMLRDLGPHAFAPLIRTGFTNAEATFMDIGLAKLNAMRNGFVPVRSREDIEMWVRTLMVWNGVTANVAFGKAPFPGKERSLAVRAANGVFFAGLARGQSAVLITNDGRTTHISLSKAENDLVLEEAIAFFKGELPVGFDGNIRSSLDALRLCQRLRTSYVENLNKK